MLHEFQNLTQEESGFRRLFFDDDLELYLWYKSKGGELSGFQLCYDKKSGQHSITYKEGLGYLHNKIDEGEHVFGSKSSPVLVEDGAFPKHRVISLFESASDNIDIDVRDYVLTRLKGFSTALINPLL